jgi:hypothetical protein
MIESTQDHFIISCLIVSLYLSWKVYELQKELDKLIAFSVESLTTLAEAIDEIEEHLDDKQQND